jgi:hypothetical protein
MILFEIRHGFLGTKSIFSYLTHPHKSTGGSVLSYVPSHFNSFVSNFQGTFPNLALFNYLFLLSIIIVSIYFIVKEKNKNFKYFFSYLLFLIPVTFVIFSFLRNTIWGIYLLHLNVAYILLLSYIFYSVFQKKYNKLSLLAMLFLLVLFLFATNNAIKVSVYDYSDYGGIAKIRGKEDAINFIYNDAKNNKFNLLVFTPGVYTYPYDYLLWWYGQRKYGFIPGNEKKGQTYLLIEKDPWQPWSYQGWLKTVIKTGKIVKTVTLPSGFIVQERIF